MCVFVPSLRHLGGLSRIVLVLTSPPEKQKVARLVAALYHRLSWLLPQLQHPHVYVGVRASCFLSTAVSAVAWWLTWPSLQRSLLAATLSCALGCVMVDHRMLPLGLLLRLLS